jgi:hypothetical protein
MMIKIQKLLTSVAILLLSNVVFAQKNPAYVSIQFKHYANQQPLVLVDSAYTNSTGESFQPTRLKYYISNLELLSNTSKFKQRSSRSIHLIDASNQENIFLEPYNAIYNHISFTIGVDSALNCSGAQSGPLDPVNGMFWTWNTGYIYFKLEGYSAASTNDLQKIEYHIGGYTGAFKANRKVTLTLPEPLLIEAGKSLQIMIHVDLDKFWNSKNNISIAANALIMSPGALAAAAADNLPAMFSIGNIE